MSALTTETEARFALILGLLYKNNNTRQIYSKILDIHHRPIILNMLIDEVNEMLILAVILVGFTALVLAGVVVGESVATLG